MTLPVDGIKLHRGNFAAIGTSRFSHCWMLVPVLPPAGEALAREAQPEPERTQSHVVHGNQRIPD